MVTQNCLNTISLESKMNDNELDAHIESKNWKYVNTIYEGSEDYRSSLGVMRLMFNVDHPQAITTLLSDATTEVWIKENGSWNNAFTSTSI